MTTSQTTQASSVIWVQSYIIVCLCLQISVTFLALYSYIDTKIIVIRAFK